MHNVRLNLESDLFAIIRKDRKGTSTSTAINEFDIREIQIMQLIAGIKLLRLPGMHPIAFERLLMFIDESRIFKDGIPRLRQGQRTSSKQLAAGLEEMTQFDCL
jgi:hypothetical protein